MAARKTTRKTTARKTTRKQEPKPLAAADEQPDKEVTTPDPDGQDVNEKVDGKDEDQVTTAQVDDGNGQDAPEEVEVESPWTRVEALSDNEMDVEVVNVSAYQRNSMLLRIRVNGELTGDVMLIDRMHYKPHDGTFGTR
ncbi:MAG: hypothetical protein DRH10_00915 [Deltaproteobacteria bacterium]|nr:MAG: hypothetical protein DRH10_00915 [Deltaproteobacteria bacterium]RLC88375.1 MAG: hypothetical protein DRJ03_02980 [Chloroflexota bacterium]